ncbi:MAG: YgiT-type zinc finger protein [Clostridiales bacterium]|jgi:YgiT-type zinc finger domain-containing protein|nr:YgiT-type zinc finger protein [Clostridiales bacterium]
MKCGECKSKAERVLTETEFDYNGVKKQAVNVPALYCPNCKKTVVPDMIYLRLKDYAERFGDDIIDFTECDNKDSEDMMIVTNMMWNM